ncbi:hypothetical protein TSTA_091400 [Talaromyces stipitatus ATCC 10500]|uniref:Uncharacterized protein n=1 Tax=Talaromyces stipitatus (strain ATCC 10500 / CBS 375.48 / QM 6759 / NRRL 1006) TaxID=441959 RepID=B8M2I8_TALSN|nr:uncharacterized protein TSTA_091400 [Talaromyces stipitatus ATCC 10500]EED21899.1 hypothetical protein TSTA_091400 [Talaromyces stipitatus ATCC 10500]
MPKNRRQWDNRIMGDQQMTLSKYARHIKGTVTVILFAMVSRLVDHESSEYGAEPLPEPSPPEESCEPHTQIPAPSTD